MDLVSTVGKNIDWYRSPVANPPTLRPGVTAPGTPQGPTPPGQSVVAGLTPGGTDEVAGWIESLISAAASHRNQYDNGWPRYYQFYRNQQWGNRRLLRGTDWKAYLTINYLYSIIDAVEAVLFDQDPQITVAARAPEQHMYAASLQAAIDHVWDRRDVMSKLASASRNARIYGNGYLKCFYNYDCENGQGDIDVSVVPTENLFVDPAATSLHNAQWVIEVHEVPLSYLKRHYENGWMVTPDSASNSFRRRDVNTPSSGFDPNMPLRWQSPIGDNPLAIDQTEYSSPPYKFAATQPNSAKLFEVWTKDYSVETINEPISYIDPNTGLLTIQEVPVTRPKYPYGRVIHYAGGHVLEDRATDYPVWPYVRIVDNDDPDVFYGFGMVELLKDLQIELNKRRSQMVDHAALMGNAVWILDTNSNVNPEMLTNKPGMIIWKQSGTEVRREPPPPMPPWLLQAVETTIRDMREISGVSGVPGGIPPKGVRSGAGFQAAADISNTRIRQKARALRSSMSDLGRIMISLIQTKYTTPRMIRLTGSYGQVAFIPFDGQHIRGDWDISIEAGAALPTNKAARIQQAIQLFQLHVIDGKAVLDACDWPGADEIQRRMGMQPAMPMPEYANYPGLPSPDRSNSSTYSGYSSVVRQEPNTFQLGPGPAPNIPSQGGMGYSPAPQMM